jgi:hypothetical protein
MSLTYDKAPVPLASLLLLLLLLHERYDDCQESQRENIVKTLSIDGWKKASRIDNALVVSLLARTAVANSQDVVQYTIHKTAL